MPSRIASTVRGKSFELLVKRLLLSCNFTEVVPDGTFVYNGSPGVMLQGFGQPHNADVLVEPPFQTPFYFPSRLLVECKCYKRAVNLPIVRGVLGLREDINGFDIVTKDILRNRRNNATSKRKYYPMKRYHYQVAIASMHGFASTAIPFALAHKIPLISFGQSALFKPICECIDQLVAEASLDRRYGKWVLKHIAREERPKEEEDSLSEFFSQLDELGRKIQIGLLEDGTILFLLRCEYLPACCDYYNRYDDGYTLHWDNEGTFWYLVNRDVCYAFELPKEMHDGWMRDAVHRREIALRLKKESFEKIYLFGNKENEDWREGTIRVLHLSQKFIDEAAIRIGEDRR